MKNELSNTIQLIIISAIIYAIVNVIISAMFKTK